jgi:predicted MFS family arabinose efflux permease
MENSPKIFTRDFILAFLAQLALTSVMQLLIPTLPIYLKGLGSSETEIGTLIGMLGLASVVSRPFVGRLVHLLGEKTFMLAGAGLQAVSSVSYLLIAPFWPFLFTRLIHGAGFGFFHSASTMYVVGISPASRRGSVLGYFSLTMNIAAAIAPPLGIVIINRFGFTHLFVICSVISLFMVLASATLRKGNAPVPPPEGEEEKPFFFSRDSVPPSIISFFGLFVWASVTTFFPLYATSRGMTNPGLFFSAMAIMLILGRTCGGRLLDMPNKAVLIPSCIFTTVIAMALLAFSKTLPMFLAVAVIWGAGHAFLMPALLSFALERSGASTGPTVATFYAITDTGVFLGPLIMGVVAQHTSYPIMFLCLSLVGVISLLYFWYFTRKRRSGPNLYC